MSRAKRDGHVRKKLNLTLDTRCYSGKQRGISPGRCLHCSGSYVHICTTARRSFECYGGGVPGCNLGQGDSGDEGKQN